MEEIKIKKNCLILPCPYYTLVKQAYSEKRACVNL